VSALDTLKLAVFFPGGAMISIDTMKHHTQQMIGRQFPLVMWRGVGRIVASDDAGLSLLIAGMRVHLTWDRLTVTWKRLLANYTLGIDELGGGADAVGAVSLFAFMLRRLHDVSVVDPDGLLVLKELPDTPEHQYADMGRPTTWAPWRRAIHGS
jgi:hypothetical protein